MDASIPLHNDLIPGTRAEGEAIMDGQNIYDSSVDYEYAGDTRTVDVHVRWLREKLEEDPANPVLIQTMRGVGYVFR